MKILVTGSRGYCGVAMVPALLERGHEVVGLDVTPLPDGYRDRENHREVQGGITDPQLLFSLLDGCHAVVHAAIGRYVAPEPRRSDEPFQDNHIRYYDINVSGTVNLLEAARQRNARQFVLISSTAVVLGHLLGPDNSVYEFRVDAHTPPNFQGPYSFSKFIQEQFCEFYARTHGLSVTVLRPCWVVDGPSGLTKFGAPVTNPGEWFPFAPTGFVDRHDLGVACHLALQRPDIVYDIFYPVAGTEPERYFDVEHIRRELGWYPRYTFADVAPTQGKP
ncbi:MAG: NAD(P)-dependent oxidoreductase [Anaerolineae bacterium]|nr:NAD(P)-dependent oxidoreductase [Anaerolineae bacterium]